MKNLTQEKEMYGKPFCTYPFFIVILSLGTAFGANVNVLTNPGFETGTTTGWAARSATISAVTSPTPHGGTYAGRATGRTATWNGIQQNVLGKMVIGQAYTVSGWIRTSTTASSTVHLSFQKTDSNGTSYAWAANGTASSSGWTYVSGSYPLTANGTLTELLVYAEGPDSGIDIYLDDVNVFGLGPDPNAAGSVNTGVRHQVLEGFGAAGAWYEGSVLNYSEPTRTNLYNTMFGDLGLDIYRVRNTYGIDSGYITRSATIIAAAATSLGHPIRVMNSSWSPPASLKSNNDTVGGTLAKDGGGNYRYADFAQWWRDSLNAWSDAGVGTYYLNMQNEPGWLADWDTCRWDPTENTTYAGYQQGFAALYANLNSMSNRPKLLAPESQNVSGTASYINALTTTDKANVYGWSHHLYDGSADTPDQLVSAMATLKASFGDRPILQTEFAKGEAVTLTWTDAINLAILMNNCLTVEDASAYVYWELFWASPKGLVSLTTPNPTINTVYYAFKHFSKFTDPNWQRVDASTNSTSLRISAYISPANDKLSVVIINTASSTDVNLNLSFTGFTIVSGDVYRSSSTQNCVLLGSYNPASLLVLPAYSITTLALSSGQPDTNAPAIPTGLTATPGNSTVSLNWNDNAEGDLAGYNVYRSLTSGSGYIKLNGSLLSSSNYTDNDASGHRTYYYVVTAVDTSTNESSNSSQVSATPTDTIPPATPTGLSAIAGNQSVLLNWSDNGESDLAGYNVYRSTTSGSGYIQLNGSPLSSSDYNDNSVVNGTTYYYVVTAEDIVSNESAGSSEVSAMPRLVTDVEILGSWLTGTTHAKESGTDRVLVFIAHVEDNDGAIAPVSATYGGQTMTKIIDTVVGSPTQAYVVAYILGEAGVAAATTSTLAIDWGSNPPDTVGYASLFLQNVGQTTLVGATASNAVITDPVTTSSLATSDGDMVIDAVTCGNAGTYTLTGGFTEGTDQPIASTATGATGYKSTTGVPETPGADYTGSTMNRQVIIGFVVQAAAVVDLPPASPTGLLATAGIATVVLDWNDNNESDLAGYNVYRSITSGSGYSRLNGLSDSNYTDTNVSNGTTYYYVVTAVDTGSNESGNSGEVSATPSNPADGTGSVLYEFWSGIAGTAVSGLTSDVNYPDNSSGRELILKLQGPVNWADDYGASIRGYLNPVTAGGYTFWLAGDDSAELWLSTDDNPDNAVLIASVPASPQSSLIWLAAGQKYYIEVLHKEGTGNDNISVSWQGPAITQQVIDGIYLSPCCLEFRDFSDFAGQWERSDCSAGNDWCGVADFNHDGSVLLDDFKVFADTWLLGI